MCAHTQVFLANMLAHAANEDFKMKNRRMEAGAAFTFLLASPQPGAPRPGGAP